MAVHKKALTNRAVASLKVERDMVYWDRDLSGFGVRVYPGGGKVYIAPAREAARAQRHRDHRTQRPPYRRNSGTPARHPTPGSGRACTPTGPDGPPPRACSDRRSRSSPSSCVPRTPVRPPTSGPRLLRLCHAALRGLISMGLRLNEDVEAMALLPRRPADQPTRVIRFPGMK